jgi:DNA-binding MarR family transcriptional regulator
VPDRQGPAGATRFDYRGEYFTLVGAQQRPTPTRHIPVTVGGIGKRTPEMARLMPAAPRRGAADQILMTEAKALRAIESCTWYSSAVAGYPQLQLDRQLCFALYTASRAIVRAYGPLLEGTGLTYPQYITMLVLWEDAQRPRTVGELGERLHLDSGTLTPLLKRLESTGYVTRSRDAQDERRVLVTLTAEGLSLRDRLAAVPESLFERCRGFDVTEVESLREQLVALTAALES